MNAVEAIANSLSLRLPKSNNANVSLTAGVPLGNPTSRSDAMSRPNADDWIAPKSNNANVSLISDVPLGDSTSRSDAMSRSNADDWIAAETEELASHDKLQTYIWVKEADLIPGSKI